MLKTPSFDQPSRCPYENSASRGQFASKVAHIPMKTPHKRLILAAFCLSAGQACASGPSPVVPPEAGGVRAAESSAGESPPGEGDRDPEDAEATRAAAEETPADRSTPSEPASSEPVPIPEGTKVLHVGDSFAGALGKPLGELMEAAGMRSVLKHTDASYLTDWAWDGNLQKYIWKYNPDLVLVTLGANELEIENPELREKTVRKIVEIIGDKPCVWVAIPLWDGPKNGLLDVIKKNSQPCHYMDTNALFEPTKMARIRDGIHPTTEARKTWAEGVFSWLREQRRPTPGRPWNIE